MNYSEMSLEELSAISGPMAEKRDAIAFQLADENLSDAERLKLELERAEYRAHLNIIQPLRAQHMIREQRLRSAEVQRLAGMTDDEFEAHQAKMRELRQDIRVAGGPDGVVQEPGASAGVVVEQ